jgi:hypothetical protein
VRGWGDERIEIASHFALSFRAAGVVGGEESPAKVRSSLIRGGFLSVLRRFGMTNEIERERLVNVRPFGPKIFFEEMRSRELVSRGDAEHAASYRGMNTR